MATALQQTGVAGQTRTHMGHSHGHGHDHHPDTRYLTSKNRSDAGVRITRIGLFVNLGMAVAKGIGGYVFNSQALTADAVHALTDMVSDFTTLATISYSLRPATTRFPLGYGKIESLGALAVSGILLSGGFMIGMQAMLALSHQLFPGIAEALSHFGIFEFVHHHGHDHGAAADLGPNINAAWLAAASIALKEWLYRATMKVAKEKRSSVLASNAYHHRVDSLTAFVALFTIVASNFLTSARWLDPVGGLVISGMIVQAGWVNTKSALFELADVTMDKELRDNARKIAADAVSGPDAEIRGVQGTKSGQNLIFEIEIAVPPSWTVQQSNHVEEEVRQAVGTKLRGTKRVAVRFVTAKDGEPFVDQLVQARPEDYPEGHEHEHSHDNGHGHHHDNGDAARSSGSAGHANGAAQKRK